MLERLERTIAARAGDDPAASYTARLAANPAYAARKFGEEAVELVVAALAEGRESVVGEAADVVYHLLVLLATKGATLADVEAELARREGVSGLAEKAARG